MTEHGLWSMEFLDRRGEVVSGGIAVLENGKLLGGDSAYYYAGTYSLASDRKVRARLSIKHFAGAGHSIFGPMKAFEVEAEGVLAESISIGSIFTLNATFWESRTAEYLCASAKGVNFS